MQRREHVRYQLWFPVRLESGHSPKIAMNHNIGPGGMLVAVASELSVGEQVTVTFRLPNQDVEHSVRGRVLRLEPNVHDPEGSWPHRVAIAFEDVAPQLEPYLEQAAERLSGT